MISEREYLHFLFNSEDPSQYALVELEMMAYEHDIDQKELSEAEIEMCTWSEVNTYPFTDSTEGI